MWTVISMSSATVTRPSAAVTAAAVAPRAPTTTVATLVGFLLILEQVTAAEPGK